MSKPEHTPGPWRIHSQGSTDPIWIIGPEPKSVFLVQMHEGRYGTPNPSRELLTANARLIAAAPALLLALKRVATLLETHGGQSERMREEAYRVAMDAIIEH